MKLGFDGYKDLISRKRWNVFPTDARTNFTAKTFWRLVHIDYSFTLRRHGRILCFIAGNAKKFAAFAEAYFVLRFSKSVILSSLLLTLFCRWTFLKVWSSKLQINFISPFLNKFKDSNYVWQRRNRAFHSCLLSYLAFKMKVRLDLTLFW